MVGRKTKLTPELAEKIANYISTGNYAVVVCGLVGIGESTYYSWLEKGVKAKSGKYREFLELIKRAEAAREAKWIKDIDGDPSWQSKAWLLERRYPERWGKKETHVVEGGDEKKPIRVEVNLDELLDQYEAIVREIQKSSVGIVQEDSSVEQVHSSSSDPETD